MPWCRARRWCSPGRAGHVRLGFANRQRRGRPDFAGFLVAEIDGFARRVGDRIVGPGRQTVRPAIFRPGAATARFRHHAAKTGIGDHVAPGRGSPTLADQLDYILVTIGREPAQAIVKLPGWLGQGFRGFTRLPVAAGLRDLTSIGSGGNSTTASGTSSCFSNDPSFPTNTTCAAACSKFRSSSGTRPPGRMKMPPRLFTMLQAVLSPNSAGVDLVPRRCRPWDARSKSPVRR